MTVDLLEARLRWSSGYFGGVGYNINHERDERNLEFAAILRCLVRLFLFPFNDGQDRAWWKVKIVWGAEAQTKRLMFSMTS